MRSSVLFAAMIYFLGLGFDSNLAAAPAAVDDEGRAFHRAVAAFEDGLFPEASMQLRNILKRYPRSQFRNQIVCLLGQAAYEKGDYDRAAVNFRRVLRAAENPSQECALYYLGLTQVALGRDALAITSLEEFLKKYPTSGVVSLARLTMGKSLARLGKLQGALAMFRASRSAWGTVEGAKILEADGQIDAACVELIALAQAGTGNPLGQGVLELWLGNLQLRAGRSQQALEWYSKAMRAADERVGQRAALGKSQSLQRMNNVPAAILSYESFLTAFPTSRWAGMASVQLAQLRLGRGDTAGAEQALAVLGRKRFSRPWREAAASLRCQIAIQAKQYDLALSRLHRFLALYADSTLGNSMRYQIAWILFNQGKYPEALAAADRCLPSATAAKVGAGLHLDLLILKGDAMNRLARPDEAIALYRLALEKSVAANHRENLLQRLGHCLYQSKRWGEAAEILEQLLLEFPRSDWTQEALARLGFLRMQSGDYAKAAAAFKELATKFPDAAAAEEALYSQGVCLYRLGQYEQALIAYKSLMQRYPGGQWAMAARLESGWSLAALGRNKEAAEIFVAGPPTPETLFWLGQERLGQNDFADAAAFFNKVAQGTPGVRSHDAVYCEALALAQSGRHEESNAALWRLLAQDVDGDLRMDAQFLRADNEAAMKHYTRAFALFEEIATAYHQDIRAPAARLRAADCLAARGDFTAAMSRFSAWTNAANPAIAAEARFKKAVLLEASGEMEEAKELLLALVYDRDSSLLWAGKSALLLGQIFEREDRPGDALRLYEKVALEVGEEREVALQRVERLRNLELYERSTPR